MTETFSTSGVPGGGVVPGSGGHDRELRSAEQAVAGLMGRLGALQAGIGEEMRDRYAHALALKEFAETMYLAFGEDLQSDVTDIRYDKMAAYGGYLRSNLLGDRRLRESVEFLAADAPEARALLDKLERAPDSFTAQDGMELINSLLDLNLNAGLYRNAAGHGLSISLDQMAEQFDERRFALEAAIREAQKPLRILEAIVAGQEAAQR